MILLADLALHEGNLEGLDFGLGRLHAPSCHPDCEVKAAGVVQR